MKKLVFLITIILSFTLFAQKNHVKFEHIALLLPNPEKAAEWYCSNLDMQIVNKGKGSIFVTDSAKNIMIEFLINNDVKPLNFRKINMLSLHIAFNIKDAESLKKRLIENGAEIESDLKVTDSGDKIMNMRDPWGVPLQFVERKNSMLRFEGLYVEHIAFNLLNAVGTGDWFVDKLNMIIIKQNNASDFGRFVADSGKNLLFELYQNSEAPVLNFNDILPAQFHVAFSVENIDKIKEILKDCEIAQDLFTTESGDKIMVLRNKDGVPLQFVQRKKPML
ncbi:VOC family protein [Melioribacter sp. OK-6-Me]|uniref:VOC family protein n=1 Tax=Melioribacter sp. OK-6-Me TaxID=3423433 RepID=UPI003EDA1A3A